MDHRSPNFIFRHCLPMTFTMDDSEWVNSEKEACSASFSYWAANGKSTGWNWPLGWKRSHEENRHLLTPFLGIFYPTLKKKMKSETMILGGVPCSQSVRRMCVRARWDYPCRPKFHNQDLHGWNWIGNLILKLVCVDNFSIWALLQLLFCIWKKWSVLMGKWLKNMQNW